MMRSRLVLCLVALAAVLGCDGLARENNMGQNQKVAGVESPAEQTTDFLMNKTEVVLQLPERQKCDAPMEDAYVSFDEMEWYLQNIEARYPAVEVSSIGKTEEGRDLWLVKMVQQNSSKENQTRVAVWIEGGIYAREWIASSTSFHLAEIIAKSYNSSSYFDYYIVPMANPDGYEYCRTTYILWRKNRSKKNEESKKTNDAEQNRNEEECVGVDLNRNWDDQFSVGASDKFCNIFYHGQIPFEKIPCQDNTSKALESNEILPHSYGNSLLFPWGYTSEPIEDADTLKAAGESFIAKALKVNGTKFKVDNSAAGLHFASGATDDLSKNVSNSSLVYTVELRVDKKEKFELPEEEIKPTADKVYAGLEGLLKSSPLGSGCKSAASYLTGWTSTIAIVACFHLSRFMFQ